MSLLFASKEGWIISHLQYVNEMYGKVVRDNGLCALSFNELIFEINSQYLRQNQVAQTDQDSSILHGKRKRKRLQLLPQKDLEKVDHVKQAFNVMISAAKNKGLFGRNISLDNNQVARLASEKFYQDTYCLKDENLYGSNDTDDAIISEAHNKKYVFPKKCTFYCYDVRDMEKKIELNNQYDFILLDPPWWNKSIRRKKIKCAEASYKMMYNEELVKIPIKRLLHSNGILAIWCTNSSNHLNSIFNEIFPSWGITYRAKWYWIKVTQAGDTICNFNSAPGKQPYELLILGSALDKGRVNIPDGKLMISVPSAVHSHKPPLTEIIKEYLPSEPKCLEIFARYLLPGWTSWGLEILKFQHLSLYEILDESGRADDIRNENECDD
ncbi:N(6)-adenine-specific methyltransferase METTL4 isoform X1 [Linepithema humile]|uniref:N(6)-adenine-specific methyltransferase METTL4 isoform X1 n=1 Tax=Linepithema humile TaxID=83485 RepID=UPI0006239E79|nr:PREDICTED: methyltransferase-like protein 4 isoform X1 [Linepithema humile]XP_012227073.1 PREDICTED: methyltransferase-like protein 4 isoform X1 [Linepithema humile]XP_012227074.1 PREDICTED: methyltransferase-like protein 4 isoform X1 [Linepithema humile]XP_012227075.1 PREDICTED: methyltransferase-like protein 4 isoform X1 [Linepithema humile]XP_012227076.1 PREDICTED: methyltransferase-like protein 4 isoform X1 [Linepithema humile]XP_012227077.1 PREDICTED: methyltransferase-like protein 4 i